MVFLVNVHAWRVLGQDDGLVPLDAEEFSQKLFQVAHGFVSSLRLVSVD